MTAVGDVVAESSIHLTRESLVRYAGASAEEPVPTSCHAVR